MTALPISLQLLPAFAALLLLVLCCAIVAAMGWRVYRWTRERHAVERGRKRFELLAVAARLARTKGEGIEA